MRSPNVIFCSMQNAGGSAIDPVLRELLSAKGYFMPTQGPEASAELCAEVAKGAVSQPFYHWTHDAIATFRGMIGDQAYRFIFLHRDPRDIAVSMTFDYQKRGFAADHTFSQILDMIATVIVPQQISEALEWARSGCMVITFVQMKKDTPAIMRSLLPYIRYAETDELLSGAPITDGEIARIIDKYRYETVTGRARGDEGEVIRTAYLYRKGLSGEWRKHFDENLIRKSEILYGAKLRALGYPPDGDGN